MRLHALAVASVLAVQPSVHAAEPLASSISCMDAEGIPATVVSTKSGKRVPIIYWKSETFSSSGWNPTRRCKEVSARFQEYHQAGTLEFITTGRMNGMPVLCVSKTDGGGCAGLLYTLKPGQNATATLKKLFDIRNKPGAAPLEETTARLYVNFETVVRNKAASGVTSSPSLVKPVAGPNQSAPLF
ncbi:COP23 domain-containing protein [Synechococcus sp. LTW-R]|uniref:COP23 domain-containing protein n=1 Tax=Synechococcus sp. LTW-R TaxID=2751170 RepID=UPI001626D35A|nr:COP23 domain-containing protein [Synechococcus sp. LTW-R]QNG30611.1 hypothetical protein H0O22_05875 [Synechococcus sp. LTW-R]